MEPDGLGCINDPEGVEPELEGFQEMPAIQEHGHRFAFRFAVGQRNGGPRCSQVIFEEKPAFLVLVLDAQAVVLLVMVGELFNERHQGIELVRIEGERGMGVSGRGNDLPPVRVAAVDELGDEPPSPAADLEKLGFAVRNVRESQLPGAIEVEVFEAQEFVLGDDQVLGKGQIEGIAAEQMPAIRAHQIVILGLADIEAGTREDAAGFIHAGAGHGIMQRQAEGFTHRHRLSLNPGDGRELLNRTGGDFGFSDLVSEIEAQKDLFLGVGKNMDLIPFAGGFDELAELFKRHQQGKSLAFGGLFQAHRDEPVEVGGGETDPAFGGSFDLEGFEDQEGGLVDNDFAEAAESRFELRDRQGDGMHED